MTIEIVFMAFIKIPGNSFIEISLYTKKVIIKAYTQAIAAASVAVNIPPITPTTTIMTVTSPKNASPKAIIVFFKSNLSPTG